MGNTISWKASYQHVVQNLGLRQNDTRKYTCSGAGHAAENGLEACHIYWSGPFFRLIKLDPLKCQAEIFSTSFRISDEQVIHEEYSDENLKREAHR